MRKIFKSAAFAIFCLWSFSVANGQSDDKLPADLVQRDTMLIAKFELDEIEIAPLLDTLSQMGFFSPPEAQTEMQLFLDNVRRAGASRYYLSVPTEWISNGAWCAIMPTDNPAALAAILRNSGVLHTRQAHSLGYVVLEQEKRIVICPKAMENRFSENTEKAQQAIPSSVPSGYPHWLYFSLPDSLRPALAAILPDRLPAEMGIDFSPNAFAYNVRGISLGWSLPPNLEMEMVIEGNGSKGANGAKAQLEKLLPISGNLAITSKPTITEDDRVVFKAGTSDSRAILAQLINKAVPETAKFIAWNLKNIGLAFFNYVDKEGHYPGKAIHDKDGRPLLSWRVALLPYLGEEELYNKFKLDEPWDSAHNKQLLSDMPTFFADQMSNEDRTSGMTRYRLPVMPGTIWAANQPIGLRNITDGLSNTIIAAYAPIDKAVEWTRPDDWILSEANLIQDFFGSSEVTSVGTADGAVHALKKNTVPPIKLKSYLQYADGRPYGFY